MTKLKRKRKMKIQCKDGDFLVPEQLLMMSQQVRNFTQNQASLDWAKGQSVEAVFNKMNELMWS